MLGGLISGFLITTILLTIIIGIVLANQDYKIELMQADIDYLTKILKEKYNDRK